MKVMLSWKQADVSCSNVFGGFYSSGMFTVGNSQTYFNLALCPLNYMSHDNQFLLFLI